MRIGIDARLLERKMTGIGRFLSNILKELPILDKQNKYFLFSFNKLNSVDPFFYNVFTGSYIFSEKLFSPYWTNVILPRYLQQYKIDIYFSVNKILPYKKLVNIKYVSVIHDVFYKIDTSFHPYIYRKYLDVFLKLSIKKSDLIITVSHNSKKDIIELFDVAESKIKIVHEAADEGFHPIVLSESEKINLKTKFQLSDKFVLYVGVIENRKNIYGVLRIADLIYRNNKELKLLLVGRAGFGSKNILKEIRKRENVVYLEYVDDQTLKKLYNISRVFLFISFYEGFGLPPLEAMQSGVPVVVSNSSSLPEVVDMAGIIHDPRAYQAVYMDIMKLIEDDTYYLAWREKGLERAKHFSVKNTTKNIVEIFNSLIN
ncbi:MAG: glycosyltransferase family 4 protein [Ignavibacteria bacterium]|nr:glycosyltransferase family 4 protein [Ignavibacteria bacterium]MBT8383597.1 glycosyltransferase family 4 protein [Ignavibacteria bacterium]MBT8392933.1 glycosyltransferase family 4 protein [Ignavibacteria bacterium]NNL20730.1 glycosyltransferase family 4 protein [Ignavibacteriaceae bacterium]